MEPRTWEGPLWVACYPDLDPERGPQEPTPFLAGEDEGELLKAVRLYRADIEGCTPAEVSLDGILIFNARVKVAVNMRSPKKAPDTEALQLRNEDLRARIRKIEAENRALRKALARDTTSLEKSDAV